jgi:peptidoglycan hydrolase-like protein with peptidoglycan-binding domain
MLLGVWVIGFRGAAALLAAAAVTALLTGCEPLATGAAGAAPTTQVSSAAPSKKAAATPSPRAGSSATPTVNPRAKPKPTQPEALLEQGDRGEKVRELQHRLRQLEWYFGSITGVYGPSTIKAVRGFQEKRRITVTGKVDRRTWRVLVGMTRTPTRAERHNVLVPGPALLRQGSSGLRVRGLQARLKQIGWYAAPVTGNYGRLTAASVRGFQAKRRIPVTGEVDQRTLGRLRGMTRTPSSAELYNRTPKPSASGLDRRCLTGRALCISKRTNSLVWVVDGRARLHMDVRFGSDRTPTREGWFSVGWKSRNHFSSVYDTAMPYAMFFSGGQAVHYSPDFAARGYSGASHGCVNVRNLAGIQALFAQVRVGDKVIVYR